MTTDINVFAHFFAVLGILSSCIEAILRACYGPLPFFIVFGFTQVFKVCVNLIIGVLNVSGFLQFAIIMNLLWVSLINIKSLIFICSWLVDMTDEKILKVAKIGITLHLSVNIHELFMVNTTKNYAYCVHYHVYKF